MAQVCLKGCEICEQGMGKHFCLDCGQIYCDSCKILHKKQTLSRNHQFQLASETIPEVKSKCEEHSESFTLLCLSCCLPVCSSCVAGKHNGHKFSKITDFVANKKAELLFLLKEKKKVSENSLHQTSTGLVKFEKQADDTVRALLEDGERAKALIDKHIGDMVSTVKDKGKKETSDAKVSLDRTSAMIKEINELETKLVSLDDERRAASNIDDLKSLEDISEKIRVMEPHTFPQICYKPSGEDRSSVKKCIGTYAISISKTADAEEKDESKNSKEGKRGLEELITSVNARPMVFKYKKWIDTGNPPTAGLSTIEIYRQFANKSVRIIGRKLDTKEVVLNCQIFQGMKYNKPTPLFHQWRDDQHVHGIRFTSKNDGDAIAEAIMQALSRES